MRKNRISALAPQNPAAARIWANQENALAGQLQMEIISIKPDFSGAWYGVVYVYVIYSTLFH
jgi:hypothetical protein